MCDQYTGLDYEIEEDFFSSKRGDEKKFQDPALFYESKSTALFYETFDRLLNTVKNWNFAIQDHFLKVPVACTAGVHRSVAMAEKLARRVSNWDLKNCNLRVKVKHTKLWPSVLGDKDTNLERCDRLIGHVFTIHNDIIWRKYKEGRVIEVDLEECLLWEA